MNSKNRFYISALLASACLCLSNSGATAGLLWDETDPYRDLQDGSQFSFADSILARYNTFNLLNPYFGTRRALQTPLAEAESVATSGGAYGDNTFAPFNINLFSGIGSLAVGSGGAKTYNVTISAAAEDRRWTGGSPQFDDWTDTRNWDNGDNPDGDSGSRAFFGDVSGRKNSHANYGNDFAFGQIIFDAATSSYNLYGTSMTLYSKVEVTGAATQNFNISFVHLGGGNSGGTTEFNPINGDLNVGSGNIFGDGKTLATYGFKTVTFSGNYQNGSGTSNLTVNMGNTGVTRFTGNSTFSGTSTINGGTLNIDNDDGTATSGQLSGTSTVAVNSGGTLLLSGGATVTDRINNSAAVNLNGGGRINTGGLDEGTAPTIGLTPTNGTVGLGALTLQNTNPDSRAIIDFGDGANGSTLVFSSLAGASGAYLDILNWTGTPRLDAGLPVTDRLLFAANPNLSETDLANFRFYNDADLLLTQGATIIPYGNMYELVPIPEPSTYLAAALAIGFAGYTQRRRFARLLQRA